MKLQLDNWKDDEYATKSLKEAVAPRILPANFTLGRGQPSYEFYYPSATARQLGFGQLPIHLFFADKARARDTVKSALNYSRLKDREPDLSTIDLNNWQIVPFTSIPFKHWWSEWQDHLFCLSTSIYCKNINANYQDPTDEVHVLSTSRQLTFIFL